MSSPPSHQLPGRQPGPSENGGLRVARGLLSSPGSLRRLAFVGVLGGAALLWSGCLIPVPGDPIDPLPDARNRPPRIEESNVTPFDRIVQLDPANGCVLQLGLPVSDPDLDDVITVRWFVDFNARPVEGEPQDTSFSETLLLPTGREDRGSASLTLRTNTPGSRLAPLGTHLVEAYVSDGRLQVVNENGVLVVRPLPREVDVDGGVIDPNYVVSYAWFVVTPSGCPGVGSNP